MSDMYPADPADLRKQGTRGVMSTGAGLALWIVNGLLKIPVLGVVLGVGLTLLGVLGLLGKNRTDKATEAVLITSGGLGLASLLLPGLRSVLFGIGGLALVGFGLYNLFRFVRGLKTRS